MLKRVIPWAVGYVSHLLAARFAAEHGFDTEHGFVPPNRATMWPPHRPHPTPKRQRARRGRVYPKLQGGKGLRP